MRARSWLPRLLLVLPATAVSAQNPALTLQNLAPFARREVAAVVVPFARGAVAELPQLHVKGRATVWQPFGARWPDGSLRQALCLFDVEVGALQELAVPLVAGPGPQVPAGEVALPEATFEVVARIGERTLRVEPVRVAVLENNALRRVELRSARLGDSGLVVELRVHAARNQQHAYVDFGVFFSDPRLPALQLAVDELSIETRGMALFCHHAQHLGVHQAVTETGSRCVLLRDRVLGDGQGLRRTGVLVAALAADGSLADNTKKAATLAPLLGASDWRSSGAFGAFGLVPDLPPWLAGEQLRQHLAQRHRTFVARASADGDPFAAAPLGLAKNASQTGDQFDFGVVKLSVVAHSGLPSLLFEAEASVLQEACRPVHYFAADGAPIDPSRHPDWVVWSGRTHWHAGVSPDRLGKPVPEPPFETHGWTGKDRQHWSSNHLGAYALLTGSHWARAELANEARLYLSGQTIDPQRSTSGAGAPRGAGRTELAAAWAWLATGDEALRTRMHERIEKVYYPSWAGRDLDAELVRPFAISEPDARMLAGKFRYWTPWQEAIAAVGFGAAYRVTGNEHARELAEQLAMNVVRHGWRLDAEHCIIATAMRWHDGAPIPPTAFDDADEVLWSHGTAFDQWAIGACEIARVAALASGDRATSDRAAEIQRRVRAGRGKANPAPPESGGIDRLSEWDAVRWTNW